MSRNKKKDPRKSRRHAPSTKLELRLAEAQSLIDEGEFDLAEKILEPLNRSHPTHPDVLMVQIGAAIATKSSIHLLELMERYVQIRPNEAQMHLFLAGLYFSNGWFLMALRGFRAFVVRWPHEPNVEKARNSIAEIEKLLPEIYENTGMKGEIQFEHAYLHELVLASLSLGRVADARRAGEQLVKVQPDFIPGLNNLVEACIDEEDLRSATTCIQRVLTLDPDNVFALANWVRVLTFTGRQTEAKVESERLKRLKSSKTVSLIKTVEALSYLGDDEGVLDAVEHVKNNSSEIPPRSLALVEHLGAAALCRLGREPEARRVWCRVLRSNPDMTIAQDSLDDLDRPAAERHGGWAFPINHWLQRPLVDEFFQRWGNNSSEKDGVAICQQFFQQHLGFASRITLLLDRGDPFGRELALRIALVAKTPEVLAALKEFALGKRGPDEMRMRAASAAIEAGLIPSGMVRMWMKGGWHDVLLLDFKITMEKLGNLSQRGEEFMRQANELIIAHNGKAAESLLREALITDPDAPSVLNNLALAYRFQSRLVEAEALLREIHHRFPDYFFGILGMAQLATKEGRFDEAKELLDPLANRKNYHISEFCGLASTEIEFHLAQNNRAAAASWLELLERTNPKDHNLAILKERVQSRWSF